MTTTVPPFTKEELTGLVIALHQGTADQYDYERIRAVAEDHARLVEQHRRYTEDPVERLHRITDLIDPEQENAAHAELARDYDTLRAKAEQMYADLNAISERLPEHPGPIRERAINELVSLRAQLEHERIVSTDALTALDEAKFVNDNLQYWLDRAHGQTQEAQREVERLCRLCDDSEAQAMGYATDLATANAKLAKLREVERATRRLREKCVAVLDAFEAHGCSEHALGEAIGELMGGVGLDDALAALAAEVNRG